MKHCAKDRVLEYYNRIDPLYYFPYDILEIKYIWM